MEPELKLKIYVNKLGAQLRRAEKQLEYMEERVAVAREAFVRGMQSVNAVQREVEEMKKTWGTVSKQVTEMEERKKMEESLKEDFPIDEIEIEGESCRNEECEPVTGETNGDGGGKEKASVEVNIETGGKEDVDGCEARGGVETGGMEGVELSEKDEEMEGRPSQYENNSQGTDVEMMGKGTALWS